MHFSYCICKIKTSFKLGANPINKEIGTSFYNKVRISKLKCGFDIRNKQNTSILSLIKILMPS